MYFYDSLEKLEHKEEQLRLLVAKLSDSRRKSYFQRQSKQLKDPDTYACLNWFFLFGIHHCYLKRYGLFLAELLGSIFALLGFLLGETWGIWFFIALFLFELPQLFFSQRIARNYNYKVSYQIYRDLHTGK
ncbi:hypothetical protein [Vibrio ezurae]|uniref:TM2 domain-containing protein n=1 Tax=Vibrio ezurae NBRC 102218 TaxID=1219080 RepID=U3CAQ9_9VIBR|nr:hypothetical protein [Vibrio ezurae]GAD78414.1 hypothetical protein VEZ01S_01_01920 [Vibrio ezurae NBRC 102218]